MTHLALGIKQHRLVKHYSPSMQEGDMEDSKSIKIRCLFRCVQTHSAPGKEEIVPSIGRKTGLYARCL